MNNEMRSAVTEYIHLAVGNEMTGGLELSYPLHPMLERAYKFLEKRFESICIKDQKLLDKPEHQQKFIKLLPKSENLEEVKRIFSKCSTGEERWAAYK